MKKSISLLLALMFLFACLVPAAADTEAEKNEKYTAALRELESYLENPGVPGRSLDACIEAFEKLGKYHYADFFMRYATALRMIEAGQFTRMLELHLRAVSTPEFTAYIEEQGSTVLGSPAVLSLYRDARRAEASGNAREAVATYEKCLRFYDSADRYYALSEAIWKEAYRKGEALYETDDLAGAYFALQECREYRDTELLLTMIVEKLGYEPKSPEDNPCRHSWRAATCTEPKICTICGATEGSPLGHSWRAATCTQPETCAVCGATEGSPLGHDWREATYDAPETCARCGETRGDPVPRIAVGNYVTFGRYEQDNNMSNGPEPIEWRIVEIKNGKALLVSRYSLDAKPYNNVYTNITWASCTLRAWLNGAFLNEAFTAEERAKILLTDVDNSRSQCYGRWSTNGGSKTRDRVFLLSYAEAYRYLGLTWDNSNNVTSRAAPTAYALQHGANTYGNYTAAEGAYAGTWWLRSPGINRLNAACVSPGGAIQYSSVSDGSGCVRPALWISAD